MLGAEKGLEQKSLQNDGISIIISTLLSCSLCLSRSLQTRLTALKNSSTVKISLTELCSLILLTIVTAACYLTVCAAQQQAQHHSCVPLSAKICHTWMYGKKHLDSYNLQHYRNLSMAPLDVTYEDRHSSVHKHPDGSAFLQKHRFSGRASRRKSFFKNLPPCIIQGLAAVVGLLRCHGLFTEPLLNPLTMNGGATRLIYKELHRNMNSFIS